MKQSVDNYFFFTLLALCDAAVVFCQTRKVKSEVSKSCFHFFQEVNIGVIFFNSLAVGHILAKAPLAM